MEKLPTKPPRELTEAEWKELEKKIATIKELVKVKLTPEEKKVLADKIEQIKKGYTVRPPAPWWEAMREIVKATYPDATEEDVNRITAGIWHRYSPETQIDILSRIITGADGIPEPYKLRVVKEKR
jgi:hypothetical protein